MLLCDDADGAVAPEHGVFDGLKAPDAFGAGRSRHVVIGGSGASDVFLLPLRVFEEYESFAVNNGGGAGEALANKRNQSMHKPNGETPTLELVTE